jgi:hypothetical protein
MKKAGDFKANSAHTYTFSDTKAVVPLRRTSMLTTVILWVTLHRY